MIRKVGENPSGTDVTVERNHHANIPDGFNVALKQGTVLRVLVAYVDAEAVDELELALERIGMRGAEPTTVIE